MKSMSELLNDKNILLLQMIEQEKPDNLKVLSELSGHQVSNLSHTLKKLIYTLKLAGYGIVKLEKHNRSFRCNILRPIAKGTSFNIPGRSRLIYLDKRLCI